MFDTVGSVFPAGQERLYCPAAFSMRESCFRNSVSGQADRDTPIIVRSLSGDRTTRIGFALPPVRVNLLRATSTQVTLYCHNSEGIDCPTTTTFHHPTASRSGSNPEAGEVVVCNGHDSSMLTHPSCILHPDPSLALEL